MTDPVPAITEAAATGETAALFADIRATLGVNVVNLIWRHLAVFPGALPWAWAQARPLYADGTIAAEAAALRAARRLPDMPAFPPEVLAAAGLDAPALAAIGDILAAYDRTNPMALVALSVLRARLDAPPGPPEPAPAAAATREPALTLPPLLPLDAMAPATAALVLRLNRIGATSADPVLASMYRNLAHWPAYLALAWTALAPLRPEPLIAACLALARARAATLAAARPPGPVALAPAARPAVATALDRFTEDAIARMVILCGTLRVATPG